jgi:hypothetical protein
MKLRIRSWLFLFFFLLSAVAVVFSSLYFFANISFKMQKGNKQIYTDSIEQVVTTIDSYYERYAVDFIDIANSEEFKSICHTDVLPAGYENLVLKIREKMSGNFCFLDLKCPDKVRNTWYTLKQINNSADVNVDIESFLQSTPFLRMQETGSMVTFAGTLLSFYGYMLDKCLYFFCPIFEENQIAGVMINIENPDFLERLYNSNSSLKKGTIYIVDQFDNVIHYNHPSSDDYYEYDEEKETYVLEEDDVLFDKAEGIGYYEYLQLNTDRLILKDSETLQLIEQYKAGERVEPATGIVEYKGKKYFSVYQKAKSSGMNVFYFYPQKLLASPLGHVPVWEFCVIFLILMGLSFLLAHMCSSVYKKHFKLLLALKDEANKGNFVTDLVNKVPVVELVQVSKIFKNTIKTSSEHQEGDFDHLPQTVEKMSQTKKVSVLLLRIDSNSDSVEEHECVFQRFEKIMKHYSCMSVSVCGNVYMAVCGLYKDVPDFTEKLVNAALTCITSIKRTTDLKCYAGLSTGEVNYSEKTNNIWGKTVENAFDLMLLSSSMRVTICGETFKKVETQFKCVPIGCDSYQIEKIYSDA